MLEETRFDTDELARLGALIPGPEPVLAPGRIIPVCETRLDGNELRYLTECVTSNWISSAGPFVGRFEEAFARAAGCAHAVSCSSGTAALHLVLAALGLKAGDEVIVPAFTMIATANAVAYTGATPVFADSHPVTWNVTAATLEPKITPRTRALVVVHTYGHPADMDPIRELADRRGLFLLEDAAEAHGAVYRGRPVGSIGDAATFSFYGNKIVTTGEGGMITTNDERLARLVRRLRDHAFSPDRHFWHTYQGYNYRMTNLQAAVGLAQVERLPDLVEARRENRRRYEARLRGVPGLTLPCESPGVTNVFWMYSLLVEDGFGSTRDQVRIALASRGIETRTFFIPMHLQPLFRKAHAGERYPVAEELCRKGMYLPSGPALSDRDIDLVTGEILRARPAAVPALA
jgi:perosamine synthetase